MPRTDKRKRCNDLLKPVMPSRSLCASRFEFIFALGNCGLAPTDSHEGAVKKIFISEKLNGDGPILADHCLYRC